MNVELAHDAASAAQFPRDDLPEVAVLGRSNVGKSTLINAVVGRRKLARTSARPGKTRRIHFYRVEGRAYLVDLPGYGYAAVGRAEQRAWGPLVESYLRGEREVLRGALLLVDVRRDPSEQEQQLLEWLDAQGLPLRVLATKADKLGRGQLAARRRALAAGLGLPLDAVALGSGKSGRGLAAVATWFREWTDVQLRRADGSKLLG